MTFPKVYGFDSSLQLLKEKTERAISSIEFLDNKAETLRNIADFILNRVQRKSNDGK